MKIEELSIGDWILCDGEYWKISAIDGGGIWLCAGIDYSVASLEECDPISLTPEILEKNGFVRITEDMVWAEHLNPKLAKIPTWGLKIGERPVPYLVAKMSI